MTTKDKVENRIRELVPSVIHYPEPIGDNVYATGGSYTYIHLEDILMAIEKVKMKRQKTILISDDGMFMDTFFNNQHYYDLSKDFSNQSQEFYEFLWSIITPQ